jgi:hypothetical protein
VTRDDPARDRDARPFDRYTDRFERGVQAQVVPASGDRPILQGGIVDLAQGIGSAAFEPGGRMAMHQPVDPHEVRGLPHHGRQPAPGVTGDRLASAPFVQVGSCVARPGFGGGGAEEAHEQRPAERGPQPHGWRNAHRDGREVCSADV